ncbi:DUF3604 domain-containing protein [Altererythrobacter sp. GH1-8]|uniref:DUF3604 domain-containing protein n=1 Tax=Altererythrobacter sp. GH1-8 TaxID=3349333 RepID=UPI00374DA351
MRQRLVIASFAFSLICASCAGLEQSDTPDQAEPRYSSAQTPAGYPQLNLWGDLHLHTNQSFDSYAYGLTTITPDEAYRFAQGDAVITETGSRVQLSRPLDFLMVSDHAEYLGVMADTAAGDPLLAGYPVGERWLNYIKAGEYGKLFMEGVGLDAGSGVPTQPSEDYMRSSWRRVAETADRHYKRGTFTTFAGYEWTAAMHGALQHRVVMFADDAERVSRIIPFSALDSNDPQDLWRSLAAYETTTGGSVIAIPHNGNQSRGAMFDTLTVNGDPLSQVYMVQRRRFEPVVEVTQVKGDSETHPALSTRDEFAGFEKWSNTELNPTAPAGSIDESIGRDQLLGSYARGALLRGLAFEAETGLNPYQFGMIGSTDMHTGVSAAEEDNFFGKFPGSEPSADRLGGKLGGNYWANLNLSGSGYVGVWAQENTRESIFAAIKRREVYASTGPRIRLRVFGGWAFPANAISKVDIAEAGYAYGVPMGGILEGGQEARVPEFLITAMQDPDAARLDRIQVIKGWRDADGELRERVYDVAVSDGRKIDPVTHRAKSLPDTVDPATARYDRTVGAAALRTHWRDPDFDASERAFYYVRVLQVATPRWSTYDAVRYGLPLPTTRPASIQDRVYSSPIWFRPE